MSILTVDPGVATGWCYFQLGWPRPNIIATGQLSGARSKLWVDRINYVVNNFVIMLDKLNPKEVWFEQPEAFSSTTSLSGSQFKLDAACGMLIGVCIVNKIPWHLIRVREWKGQLPKSISTQRTKVAVGALQAVRNGGRPSKNNPVPKWYPRSEHAWDALGLAVYVNNLKSKRSQKEN